MIATYKKTLTTLANKTLLLAGDPLGERWAFVRACQAVNDACLDFCLRAQLIKETITIQLRAAQIEYDVAALVEDDGTLRFYGFPLRVGFNGLDSPGAWPTTLFTIDMLGYAQTDRNEPFAWHLDSVSPGKLILFGPPAADGEDLPDTENNLQVTYVALPAYMDEGADFPDAKLPVMAHATLPFGGAARLLDEGNEDDLARAIILEAEYNKGIVRAVATEYRSNTDRDDARPC